MRRMHNQHICPVLMQKKVKLRAKDGSTLKHCTLKIYRIIAMSSKSKALYFGGIPEGSGYSVPYAPHQFMQNGLMDGGLGSYPRSAARPPSPSLNVLRLIREQQDDEYHASLQADREKELLEQSAKEAAREEERRKEEEARINLEEEQEIERQLAAKEASLPQEPSSVDENSVTLLVRSSDGSRRGRRFFRTDKLQYLFNFIDVARVVKPGSYRLNDSVNWDCC